MDRGLCPSGYLARELALVDLGSHSRRHYIHSWLPRTFRVRLDVAFYRVGSTDRFHRTHVVLAEAKGASLVHILYTAKQPDEARVALNMLLDSLRAEEQ